MSRELWLSCLLNTVRYSRLALSISHLSSVVVSTVAGSAAGQGERRAAILLPTTIKHLTTGRRTAVRVHPCSSGDKTSTLCAHLQSICDYFMCISPGGTDWCCNISCLYVA